MTIKKKMAKSETFVTPKFRVSFPAVFEPRLNQLNGQEEYSLQALFSKTEDLTALKKMVNDVATKQWGAKLPANLRMPFKDQGARAKKDAAGDFIEPRVLPEGYVAGATYLDLKSREQPGIVDQNKQPILDASDFYAGCYARASIQAQAYEQLGNKGVSLWLRNLQKVAEGDSLSGRTKAEDDFAAVPSAEGASAFGDAP